MSAIPAALMPREEDWKLPSRGKTGMLCLIAAESAIFTIFVVAYIYYIGKSLSGPTPAQILHVPIFDTVCLLSSSLTIHWATGALRRGKSKAFLLWWGATLALGLKFIAGTAADWYRMIYHEGFTVKTNLFGTTYYSLVGLHASHVIVGLLGLLLVFVFALAGKVKPEHAERCEVFSYYWHFVDFVWVVVFTVVYLIGR
ncbi:MAG TPA: cytochrome c oxidase subunit 3 [Candidatus Dormibacteraeota bacterium]|nr:cytochrome c oxidase subunit 3 [Candidatus Dormibacteraeota bacterium]